VEDLVVEVEKDVAFYDTSGGGVTFSGGEPLMQADFLYRALLECRIREIHTAVDTSCCVEQETLEKVSEQADLFLCDLKHMDTIAHERCTGVGNELILANVRRLASMGKPMIIRIPIVPGFNDNADNIEATGRFAAAIGSVQKIDILPYNGGGPEKAARLTDKRDVMRAGTPSEELLRTIAARLQVAGIPVGIGG
jgi:pyruvate formate lyase activating enzyme